MSSSNGSMTSLLAPYIWDGPGRVTYRFSQKPTAKDRARVDGLPESDEMSISYSRVVYLKNGDLLIEDATEEIRQVVPRGEWVCLDDIVSYG